MAKKITNRIVKWSRTIRVHHLLYLGLMMLSLAITLISRADSGVLINTETGEQDDAVLSLKSMQVDIKIDNQHAYVKVEQIFQSGADHNLEGQYIFDLPDRATVADFAVWDNLTRIPAVIMEEHQAEEVYERIKRPQQIDPGLLKKDDQYLGNNAFKVKITPIPAYGSKRLELEYNEFLAIDGLTSQFNFPFKPSGNRRQHVGNLSIHVQILSDLPIGAPELLSKTFPLSFKTISEHEIEGDFTVDDVDLTEDLSLRYPIKIDESKLGFISYRAPERITAYDLRDPALARQNPDGFFQATAIYNQTNRSAAKRAANQGKPATPRHITILLDNSLSMYGEKIIRAYEAIDFFLHQLKDQDSFNIILFNENATPFATELQPANITNVENALQFVRNAPLESGTSILPALKQALSQTGRSAVVNSANGNGAVTAPVEESLVLITDGNPTLDTLSTKEIVAQFDQLNRSAERPLAQLYVFGIGGDANQSLLAELVAKCQGYFIQYRETEDLSTRLGLFFDKIGDAGITNINFQAQDNKNFSFIYPITSLTRRAYDGANFSFVGRYKQPKESETIAIKGQFNNKEVLLSAPVKLPELDITHEQLPRLWARARVDALLREIEINGERADLISEIINLSQKYKFVTPYTSLIAAPRALLRPRVIQPGDPVIRVRTDHTVRSITAILPFGLVLPLKFLPVEDVWEARFLAPPNLPDGSYQFRLILTDKEGHGFQEVKSFIIDSHAPQLKVSTDKQQLRAGDAIKIAVDADRDTVQLTARFYGAQPVRLQWSPTEKHSVGVIYVPKDLPSGKYSLIVAAEDSAHNNSTSEVEIEVIGL